jgi:uncharacterized protein with NAD-binding domain and iron-sulfur cluster
MSIDPPSKKKIAVLGGGAAAMSAVFHLTQQPGWQDRYEVTVYQLGWRLGGKGATGRDVDSGQRILEHGLHLWFGFYENAFAMMRQVYAELRRGPDVPIATFEQAFLPHNQFVMQQQFQGKWQPWQFQLPPNPSTPGDGLPFPPPWDYVIEAIELLWDLIVQAEQRPRSHVGLRAVADMLAASAATKSAEFAIAQTLHYAKQVRAGTLGEGGKHPVLVGLLRLALHLLRALLGDRIHTDLEAYRIWIGADAIGTALIGVLEDELLTRGPDVINDQNFNTWFRAKGASPELMDSSIIQAAYDSSFALFHFGTNPDMEAGTIVRGAVRMFLMFKGSVVWRFAAGTGDTVFAPLYQLLAARGVKFEFFHEVTELVTPDAGAMEVTEIHFNQQAQPKVGRYEPLVLVKNLPCWPSEPDYDQLVEGAALKAQKVDLESFWTPWKGTPKVLKKGVDFDHIVCGLSLDPLRFVATKLTARSPAWQAMLKYLQTNRTQAFQLWVTQDVKALGWPLGQSLLSTFGEPLDTWADLSVTLPSENWPAGREPASVHYFCGAMVDSPWEYPPRSDTAYPAQQDALVKQGALDYINQQLIALWPAAFVPQGSGHAFNWDLLVDLENRSGPARFDSQWWRANVDPSERYVLSTTGSSIYRLPAEQSGFTNLWLAGDFTQNGINAGCMEAAIISGAQASRGISGHPAVIWGEGTGLFL